MIDKNFDFEYFFTFSHSQIEHEKWGLIIFCRDIDSKILNSNFKIEHYLTPI